MENMGIGRTDRKVSEVKFCNCGRELAYIWGFWMCPRHKAETHALPEKKKIGRYSGKSKSEHAFNDYK